MTGGSFVYSALNATANTIGLKCARLGRVFSLLHDANRHNLYGRIHNIQPKVRDRTDGRYNQQNGDDVTNKRSREINKVLKGI